MTNNAEYPALVITAILGAPLRPTREEYREWVLTCPFRRINDYVNDLSIARMFRAAIRSGTFNTYSEKGDASGVLNFSLSWRGKLPDCDRYRFAYPLLGGNPNGGGRNARNAVGELRYRASIGRRLLCLITTDPLPDHRTCQESLAVNRQRTPSNRERGFPACKHHDQLKPTTVQQANLSVTERSR